MLAPRLCMSRCAECRPTHFLQFFLRPPNSGDQQKETAILGFENKFNFLEFFVSKFCYTIVWEVCIAKMSADFSANIESTRKRLVFKSTRHILVHYSEYGTVKPNLTNSNSDLLL